ncbi:hypothetical protein D3C86_1866310 [compost metagenome]
MSGVSLNRIGVRIKVADYTINFDPLLYISTDYTIIIALFCQVIVVVKNTLIGEIKGPFHITLNSIFVWGQGEK